MADRTVAAWTHDGLLRRWVDYPTLRIVAGWIGLLLLWPDMPVTDANVVPYEGGLVVASGGLAEADGLYKRPDLIAFPSSSSFAPLDEGEDSGAIDLLLDGRRVHMLEREKGSASRDVSASGVALAAEAIREIGVAEVLVERGVGSGGTPGETPPVTVACSGGLSGAGISWSEADAAKLFGVDQAWEVELSVVIADDGRPEEVYIEKQSGGAEIDALIVRALLRPNTWSRATAGRGTVLVSFSPSVTNGERNED